MRKKLILGSAGALWLLTSFAHAQTLEDKLRDQLRATLNQLHQLQDDQAALQAQKTQAEQERDALKTQLAAAKAELGHTRFSAGETRALEGEVEKIKDAYGQAQDATKQAQTADEQLKAQLAAAQSALDSCTAKNTDALKIGSDILDAYRQDEPLGLFSADFGSFRDTEFENRIQDFEDRLAQAKYGAEKKQPAAQH